ncbi:MAG: hypothetical protein JXJ04_07305 [Spirochaetales bacterium]|nr:hypothetical protein [Spirochaetales bacterium]
MKKNFLSAFFLSAYKERPLLFQLKSKALLITSFVLGCASLFFTSVLIFAGGSPVEILIFSVGVFLSVLMVLFLKKGMFLFSSNLAILSSLTVLSLSTFTSGKVTSFQIYNLSFLLVFVLLLTCLLAIRNYQFFIVSLLGIVLIIFFYFYFVTPVTTESFDVKIINFAASLIIFSLSILISFSVNRLVNQSIQNAVEESQKNVRRFFKLENLVESSGEGLEIGENLMKSTKFMLEKNNKINLKLTGIKKDMEKLYQDIERSNRANSEINEFIIKFKDFVANQGAAITESSASIEEMTSSINNITCGVNDKKGLIQNLVKVTLNGVDSIQDAMSAIRELSANIKNEEEIIDVIVGISNQTDLLAMNASIEAAHAGDAGKGFAVVAEEIKKLAEDTRINTKMITDTVERNRDKVANAENINRIVGEYFQRMNTMVSEFSRVMDEVIAGMNELSGGTSEILNAVSTLLEMSNKENESVEKISRMMIEGKEGLESIGNFGKQLKLMIEEINTHYEHIGEEANKIDIMGQENVNRIKFLLSEVEKIKEE